jgi:glycosyltransferase 2 family protein
MKLDNKKIFQTLNPNKVWVPILIGLGIVFALFYSDPNLTTDNLKVVVDASPFFIFLSIFVIFCRDFGYVYRIREITDRQLTWSRAIYVIILWEFASAVTPSVVGGTAVAMFILNKEGIKMGKAIAYVMVTAILDNLFFVIGAPIILFFAKGNIFPESKILESQLGNSLQAIFWISYTLYASYSFVMAAALFYRPRIFKWLLIRLFSIKFLRKWKHSAHEYGDQIIEASRQLSGKNYRYWLPIIGTTIFIWSSRYLMLNALMGAFVPLDVFDNIIVFARQVIMWIVMMISPTPGSSGTAEYFYGVFFEQFLGKYTFVTSIVWRLLSYYPYLILGAIFLPRWIRQVFFKKKTEAS